MTRFLTFVAVPVVLTSMHVFVQAFLAWRAGVEGWRPGANVSLMMGSATTMLLVASTLLIMRRLRDRSTPDTWRRYVAPWALTLLAFVLLWLRIRWDMQG